MIYHIIYHAITYIIVNTSNTNDNNHNNPPGEVAPRSPRRSVLAASELAQPAGGKKRRAPVA